MENSNELDELERAVAASVREVEFAGKAFRIQHKRVLLTYKTHIPKQPMREFLEKLAKSEVLCYVAHERASSKTDYEHSHVYVDFGKTFHSRSSRVFDFNGMHPNIAPVVTKSADAVLRYISKEDPDLVELKMKYGPKSGGLMDAIWKHDNVQDALSSVAFEPGDITGVIAGFGMKQEENEDVMLPEHHLHYEWQRLLWIRLLQDALWDYRSLVWIYDEMGGMGKSRFCRCWQSNRGACILTSASGQRDIATVVRNKIRSGWNQEVIFLDFPRGEADHKIYSSIEAMLNGEITVTKYNGTCVKLRPENGSLQPKVVVFANWLPNYRGNNTLSKDRFQIWNVYADGRVAILPNPERDARIEREKMATVENAWTSDEFERIAEVGAVNVDDVRYQDYLLNVEQDYRFAGKQQQIEDVENELGGILPRGTLDTLISRGPSRDPRITSAKGYTFSGELIEPAGGFKMVDPVAPVPAARSRIPIPVRRSRVSIPVRRSRVPMPVGHSGQ